MQISTRGAMLSAFTARALVDLKPRDRSRIDSVLAYGDRILAGLNNGTLRIYRVTDTLSEEAHDRNDNDHNNDNDDGGDGGGGGSKTELLRELDKFARYKIEQLALVKEAKVLVSLSGGVVSLHDSQDYGLLQTLAQAKGASVFAITSNVVNDPDTNVPAIVSRLVVAVKRRILMWVWRDMELEDEGPVSELSLPAAVKTLEWVSATKIVVGLSSGFVMVDVVSAVVEELSGGSGEYGGVFFCCWEVYRRWCGEYELHWDGWDGAEAVGDEVEGGPDSPGEGYQYAFYRFAGPLAWEEADYLVACAGGSRGVLEVRNPETLSLLQSIPLPAASILHIPQPNISLAHAGKGFLVASDRTIWRMEALSYDTQIDALVEKGYLDEAISLLGMLEDALVKDKASRLRSAQLEKAQSLFALHKFRHSLDLFTEVSAPPETVIRLYPKLIAGELSAVPVQDPEEAAANVNANESDTKPSGSDGSSEPPVGQSMYATSVLSLLRRTEEGSDTSSVRGEDKDKEKDKDKELKMAVRELQGYLADVRRRFQRFLGPDGTLKLPVPTASTDEASASVLKLLDFPSEDEFLDTIRDKARLVDTTLFRAHMYATPSLAGSLFRIANFCDPEVVMERLEETGRYNDLIDFLYGKKLHRQALELLHRFGQEESGLLSDQIDLILEFADWPVRTQPELGMEIFLAETENAETLSRPRVLSFLEGIDAKLAIRYLEHVIQEWNDLTPDLHQRLVVLYLDQITAHKDSDADTDTATEYSSKFLAMLKDSEQYSPAKTLDRLDRDDPNFYEARAILFSKMGQHRQVLEIYVFKLEDHEKAEEYCNHVHLSEEQDQEDTIYLTLLSLYLTPPHNQKIQNGPALAILAKHGSRLPADAALGLIPAELEVRELEFYFKGRMRAANSVFNEARIVTQLRKARDLQIQAQLALGDGVISGGTRARHVTVTEERICGVCHKRLGGSVINVFPDNSVVHLGCANRVSSVRG
ncbi:hypothetical protein N7533_008427 [Penicillium manginii]|uniref:uncharacterized protein n=1 Tax=Penicillium manginii TaxID=203109 RepID=UPI002547464C|nr:uncharacterized protein N7533_008427 [Penicillium manginii]KAJ5743557.1 hypothetical protein N7533_008427 [Penicillium manginii]